MLRFKAYGIRIGAANYLASLNGIELHHIILRGGWEFSDLCRVFEYILQLSTTLAIAGRGLAHAKNVFQGAYPPKLIRNSESAEFLQALRSRLFRNAPIRFQQSSLNTLLDVALASVIMNNDEMINTYGNNDPVVVEVRNAYKDLGCTREQFSLMGNKIKHQWIHSNSSQGNSHEFEGIIQRVIDEKFQLLSVQMDSKLESFTESMTETITRKLSGLTININSSIQEREMEIDNSSAAESTIKIPTSHTHAVPPISTLGDRSQLRPLNSLSKMSFLELICQYCENEMGAWNVAQWQVNLPNSGHRSRVKSVIKFINANMTEEDKLWLKRRPPRIRSNEWTTWHNEIPAKAKQIEKAITQQLCEAARSDGKRD